MRPWLGSLTSLWSVNNETAEAYTPAQLEDNAEEVINTGVSDKAQSIQNPKLFGKEVKPPIKSLVECRLKDTDNAWSRLRIVNRGGKVGGKHENWFNVYDANEDTEKLFSVNWDEVVEWKQLEEEECLTVKCWKDPAVIEAKSAELENWKTLEVYEEVPFLDQNYITVQWVTTQKYVDGERVVKARLVARGFQDSDIIQKDSPTATANRESVRLLLSIAVSLGWQVHSLDHVKSAFIQGDTFN